MVNNDWLCPQRSVQLRSKSNKFIAYCRGTPESAALLQHTVYNNGGGTVKSHFSTIMWKYVQDIKYRLGRHYVCRAVVTNRNTGHLGNFEMIIMALDGTSNEGLIKSLQFILCETLMSGTNFMAVCLIIANTLLSITVVKWLTKGESYPPVKSYH